LFEGHVTQVHLNDLDRAVWAFWQAVLTKTDALVKLIEETDVTVSEWERQRSIQGRKADAEILELGFSTFFLNRTNRSGIIHSGGIIGGKAQAGDWKLDCRFNKADLAARIRRVAKYVERITLYNEDAETFLGRIGGPIPANSVLYIDPPYYEKGSQLYRNSYKRGDHERIAAKLAELSAPWFLTYDNVEPIRELYRAYSSVELDIGYSVQTKRRGSELLVVSPSLILPVSDLATAH
jgi:DNA adenine methylase